MAESHARKVICFDTTPMIWGVRENADPGMEHMIERTKLYIKHIQEQRFAVMVPAPVVAEYLVGADDTQFAEMRILKRGFEIGALDAKSAAIAATLQRGGVVDEIRQEFGHPKRMIRIDAFIIAIAISEGAKKIITHNVREFEKLAKGRIVVEDVPDLLVQSEMEFPESRTETESH